MFSLAYNLPTTMSNLFPSKLRKYKQRAYFDHRNYTDKSTWKKRGFFDHRNYTKKSRGKLRGFIDQQNYIEKSTCKPGGFFDHRNCIEKVRGNHVDFSTIEITSENYAEMT